MLSRLDRGLAWLEKVLYFGAAAALALMMVSIAGDALGRYLFSHPLRGVYEVNEMYLLTAIVYLSIAQAQRFNEHISVTSIYEKMPALVQRAARIVSRSLTAALFAAISFKTGEMALEQFVMGNMTSGVVSLPSWVGWFFVAIGAGAMTLRLLLQLFSDIANRELSAAPLKL